VIAVSDQAAPRIRRAVPGDADVLASFRRLMFEDMGEGDAETLDRVVAKFVEYAGVTMPSGEYVGWVAEADGEAIACVRLIMQSLPPSVRNSAGLQAYVMNMYVDPAWRGRGLARELVSTAVEYARAAGAGTVSLHASDAGRPLYERLGFESSPEMRLHLP
jgi:GNAT superfamily N-acetyltransferase